MAIFLVVHTRYSDVEFSIIKQDYFAKYTVLANTVETNRAISKNFIKIVENLLKSSSLLLQDLDFIAAHTGPAPFTTLRTCLASINGLAFAVNKPLVGINGLDALIQQHCGKYNTIAILNAFASDIYYSIKDTNLNTVQIGYNNINKFLENIEPDIKQETLFVGNGAIIYKKEIEEKLGKNAIFLLNTPEIASLEVIINMAFNNWNLKENIEKQLMPIYIKPYSVQKNI